MYVSKMYVSKMYVSKLFTTLVCTFWKLKKKKTVAADRTG